MSRRLALAAVCLVLAAVCVRGASGRAVTSEQVRFVLASAALVAVTVGGLVLLSDRRSTPTL